MEVTTNTNYSTCLFDSMESFPYKDYVNDCKECGLEDEEIGKENSEKYWDWVSDIKDSLYFILMSRISAVEGGVVMEGTLGLWNGRPKIYPTKFKTLTDAIHNAIRNMDDFKIYLTDGVFNVEGYHHDGVNKINIYKLSPRGETIEDIKEIRPYMIKKFHRNDF